MKVGGDSPPEGVGKVWLGSCLAHGTNVTPQHPAAVRPFIFLFRVFFSCSDGRLMIPFPSRLSTGCLPPRWVLLASHRPQQVRPARALTTFLFSPTLRHLWRVTFTANPHIANGHCFHHHHHHHHHRCATFCFLSVAICKPDRRLGSPY